MMKSHRGFTLIELVISMTLIAIAILGTLLAINTATVFSGDPLLTRQAISIAESYLEEISGKAFPITPCPAGTRSTFVNVCNYSGLSEQPHDQNGNALAALSAYTVNVTVDSTTASLGFPSLTAGTQVVRVDVAVSRARMPTMSFSLYRTSY